MQAEEITAILSNWNIVPKSMISVYKSAWNIDGKYILKHGHNISEIEKSVLFTKLLSEKVIPVAEYIPTSDGKPFITIDGGYWCLMTKLRGSHMDIYACDEFFPLELGKIIARLHVALRKIEGETACREYDLIQELESYILPEITEKQLPVATDILNCVKSNLSRVYTDLSRQLIHRDMHMGNLLFENDKLTGYIDFDLSVKSVRIFDLCYFALSLLVGQIDNSERCVQWKKITSGVISGYESVLPLSDTEKEAMPILMLYIELLFVAFWSKQGNAEQTKEAIKMVEWLWE